VGVAALLLLYAPAAVVALARLNAEMTANPSWVPAARRYAIEPAVALVAALSGALLIGGWAASNATGWRGPLYARFTLGGGASALALQLTLRGIVLFVALLAPYLLLLELPFRVGMRRWRSAWLAGLAARRAEVESHVRRLSASDPRSGVQDTSDENLRSMQYDLVLLQFYREKIAEASSTRAAPIRLSTVLVALIVAAATAAVLDNGVALAHLLVK
jgi:hypothetical protein